jgi:hypothetical protein
MLVCFATVWVALPVKTWLKIGCGSEKRANLRLF